LNIFKTKDILADFVASKREKGMSIGFVPTMGALHNGHISLINASKADNQVTVCSIFVNPTQFNQKEDFDKYPRLIEEDIRLLEASGCDALFIPEVNEMYAPKSEVLNYHFSHITHSLEGTFRPGHFDGVITIVKKLFDAVNPDNAYFGQKDFQQCMVIKELISHFNLNINLKIIPTLRESDGLAMSSRNLRLSPSERKQAIAIYQACNFIKEHIKIYSAEELQSKAKSIVNKELKLEYLELCDADTLEPVIDIANHNQVVALAAAWCGNVRLIDNMIIYNKDK
jgi:pantoate--beta-alanine ligase